MQAKSTQTLVARLLTASLLATALLPGAAGAQDRLSLEKIRDAVCASADAHQETYRPYVCDPRCDCAAGQSPSLAEVDACEESPSGVFTARATLSNTPSCGRCPIVSACPLGVQPGSVCEMGEICTSGTCSVSVCD